MDLHVLAQCLKELSQTNGDINWKAYQAVMRLIERDQEHVDILSHAESLKTSLDKAFTTMVDLDSPNAKQELADLYLNLGIHRTEITKLQRLLKTKPTRSHHEPDNIKQSSKSFKPNKESLNGAKRRSAEAR